MLTGGRIEGMNVSRIQQVPLVTTVSGSLTVYSQCTLSTCDPVINSDIAALTSLTTGLTGYMINRTHVHSRIQGCHR